MVKNAKEALYIACEMERRAIRMYERGAMVCAHLSRLLAQFEAEERNHLSRFKEMGASLAPESRSEEGLVLSAYAAQVLFPGGLMEAERENAFADAASFLNYAAAQEAQAIKAYREFAARCRDESARQMFLAIAGEETAHYDAIIRRR